ncbi:MAG: hypothetical protein R2911_01390 [Caldilineaceae bacterium]
MMTLYPLRWQTQIHRGASGGRWAAFTTTGVAVRRCGGSPIEAGIGIGLEQAGNWRIRNSDGDLIEMVGLGLVSPPFSRKQTTRCNCLFHRWRSACR